MIPYTKNRELSWLLFNKRVLNEANNKDNPILERLKFYQIFISNLDEFFMIRVSGLETFLSMNKKVIDSRTNMTSLEQLEKIKECLDDLYILKDSVYKSLVNDLETNDIKFTSFKKLYKEEQTQVRKIFKEEILPLLSPLIIDFNHPLPYLESNQSYVTVVFNKKNKDTLGIVLVPDHIKQYIKINNSYIFCEKLIYDLIDDVFEGYNIKNKNIINITRNADINFDENQIYEEWWDFKDLMKDMLKRRNRQMAVRIQTHKQLDFSLETFLFKKLNLCKRQHYVTKSPFKFKYIFKLINELKNKKELSYKPLIQKDMYKNSRSMINEVLHKDILLYYPFDSMNPFLRLIKEASKDTAVTSIKITIYRLSSKSNLVKYLCDAATNGKDVTVLVELRARFDELNNIDFSEKLINSGCKVIYGFDKYKVHSKLCLITRKVNDKVSYITQIGTGNYNEDTSKIYTDYSYMTSCDKVGNDAHMFFLNLQLGNIKYDYDSLLVSPTSLKPKLLSLIEEETKKKENGFIMLKLNSITDLDIINALVKASQNNVCIKLIIRGICCVVPNVKGYTDNIQIKSIVGRFLEHSRVYIFGLQDRLVYISSADMMSRNTTRRVEVAVNIKDKDNINLIIDHMDLLWKDNVNSNIVNSEEKVDAFSILQTKDKLVRRQIPFKNVISNKLKDNNIKYLLNYKMGFENEVFPFDYKINNKVIKILQITSEINGYNMIKKYLFISKCLEKINYKLTILLKNDIEDITKKFKSFGIDVYNINTIDKFISKIGA